jgi:hypothetical protein
MAFEPGGYSTFSRRENNHLNCKVLAKMKKPAVSDPAEAFFNFSGEYRPESIRENR